LKSKLVLFSKRNKKTAKLDKRNSTKHPKVLEGKLKLQKKLSARGSNVNTTKSCATTYTRNQKEKKIPGERAKQRESEKETRAAPTKSWRRLTGESRLGSVLASFTPSGKVYYQKWGLVLFRSEALCGSRPVATRPTQPSTTGLNSSTFFFSFSFSSLPADK
jgi:hypothetical protein